MQSGDDSISKDTIERVFRSASEPLALLHPDGTLLNLNEAMRGKLEKSQAPFEILESFCRKGTIEPNLLPVDSTVEDELNLVKLKIGDLCLVAVAEQHMDSRTQRLHRRLEVAERQSITDPLTGAWNRHQFDQVMHRELLRSHRYSEPVCLALLDVDHFKRVNDEHGHIGGDRVLKELVALVQPQIRIVDSLFRWGGEEFAIILPHNSLAGSRLQAERLRAAIAEHPFSGAGSITVSIGVAELGPDESADSWFERADRALYQAKSEGRNRVVCSMLHAASEAGADRARDEVVFLPWKAGYECGHELIDSQHQQLFLLGNQLIAASLDQSTTDEAFLGLIDELIAHVGQHFHDEEQILAAVGYAELSEHGLAHAALLDKARRLRSKAEHGTATSNEVIDFLVNSLIKKHMLTADKAFFEHLVPDQQSAASEASQGKLLDSSIR